MEQKILFSWSGGKDSALALYESQRAKKNQKLYFITTITQDYQRISMHGIREVLLDKQIDSLEGEVRKIFISKSSSNKEYEKKMKQALLNFKSKNILSIGFGDIFLEDLRRYREDKLRKLRMKAFFPLWKKDTKELAFRFIEKRFKAIVSCVDSCVLGKEFVGKQFDRSFLSKLPKGVDPCGENGEFHTFVYDGPNFKKKISYKLGKIVLKDKRFYYCDLEPDSS
ncbi:MAG: adenine nucleotide alpha hydrolase [Candidatus Omnitrophica bacterium]|nr:adenine nucleotide alpha hydrolase [Candidatus Omnitrophota bacterium]